MKSLFLGLLAFLSPLSWAAVVPITTSTELRLGDGVNPVTEQHFNSCLEFDPKDVLSEDFNGDDLSAREAKLKVEQVTSYRDFDRYTNTQVSASFKSLTFSGGFSYNGESQFTMHSDQASLGITHEADYGRWYLRDPQLKPEMAALADKDPKAFFERCGTEYVAGYVLGQGVKILLTTAENSVYSYQRIQTSLNAAFNSGTNSGKLDAAFLNVTSELIKNGMLRIHLLTYGSGAMSASEAFIRHQDDIKKYREELADLVSQMKPGEAVRIAYLTRPYRVNGQYNPIFTDHQRQTLEILFSDYRRLYDTRRRMAGFMGPQFPQFAERECTLDYRNYCVTYVEELERAAAEIEKGIEVIEELALACIDGERVKDCRLPRIDEIHMSVLRQVRWPTQFRYALYQQMLEDIRDRNSQGED